MTQLSIFLLGAVMQFCYTADMDCKITGTTEPVEQKTTRVHKEGRAFDISIRKMKIRRAIEMCDYFNKNYSSIAAIGSKSKKPIACLLHKGTWWHLHFQVKRLKYRPSISLKKLRPLDLK